MSDTDAIRKMLELTKAYAEEVQTEYARSEFRGLFAKQAALAKAVGVVVTPPELGL